jgi:hypothetical protein
MTIYKTPYDTSAGNGFNTIKLKNELQVAIVKGIHNDFLGIHNSEKLNVVAITGGNSYSESDISLFNHPLLLPSGSVIKNDTLAVDFRTVVKIKSDSNEPEVKNTMEFDLIKVRFCLNFIWLVTEPNVLRDVSIITNSIYSSWISENVARRFALDPKEQMMLSIISSAFYSNLFNSDTSLKEVDKTKLEATILKATKAPYQLVTQVLSQIEEFSNISDYCNTVKRILQNPRLESFNSGLLITIIGSTWFGNNARELTAMALEHPPTWIALVYRAFKDRSYRNSLIAKITERYAGSKGGDNFLRSLVSLLEDYTGEKSI